MALVPVVIDHIIDGDSLVFIRANRKVRSRLRFVDCPERDTKWGSISKEFLENLLVQGQLLIEEYEPDIYGRILADWFVESRDVNVQIKLVRNGMAVDLLPRNFFSLNKRSILLCSSIIQAQYYARRDKLGIWSDENFIVPIR